MLLLGQNSRGELIFWETIIIFSVAEIYNNTYISRTSFSFSFYYKLSLRVDRKLIFLLKFSYRDYN